MAIQHSIRAGGLALLLFAVAGCTVRNVAPNYAFGPGSRDGLVVAALTRTGSLEFSMVLRVRPLSGGSERDLPLDTAATARDWGSISYGPDSGVNDLGHATEADPVGRLLAVELPPGDYEIFGFTGQGPLGGPALHGRYDLMADRFSLKFTVRPGQVTYLGQIQVRFADWININRQRGTFRLAVLDTQARDFALLRVKYPGAGIPEAPRTLEVATDLSQPIGYTLWVYGDGIIKTGAAMGRPGGAGAMSHGGR